jgi:hypothetical protein
MMKARSAPLILRALSRNLVQRVLRRENLTPFVLEIEHAQHFLEIGRFRRKDASKVGQCFLNDLRCVDVLACLGGIDVENEFFAFTENDPVAMTNSRPADAFPIQESAVPAVEILDLIPIRTGEKSCVASGHMKTRQQQVRAPSASDNNLGHRDEVFL